MSDKVIKTMHDNPTLKKQMDDKLDELFPAIKKSALYENRDSDGNKVLTDKNGEIVSVLEKSIPLSENELNTLSTILKIILEPETENPYYLPIKKGYDKLCTILEQRGLENADICFCDAIENNLEEFLAIICPRLASSKEILHVFENELKPN